MALSSMPVTEYARSCTIEHRNGPIQEYIQVVPRTGYTMSITVGAWGDSYVIHETEVFRVVAIKDFPSTRNVMSYTISSSDVEDMTITVEDLFDAFIDGKVAISGER